MEMKRRIIILSIIGVSFSGVALAQSLMNVELTENTKGDVGTIDKYQPKKIPGNNAPDTYADDSGDAPTADNADDADTATTGSWADEGGEVPFADHADNGGEAIDSPTADQAAYSPDADHAAYADYADDVAECSGGPFMGGDCGDLRYDGRLGLGSAPAADLDVSGDARLGTLRVAPSGRVGFAGSAPQGYQESVQVHGTLLASTLVERQTYRRDRRVTRVEPAQCRQWSPNLSSDTFTFDANGHVRTNDPDAALYCRVPVPPGAEVQDIRCAYEHVSGSWWYRPWHEWRMWSAGALVASPSASRSNTSLGVNSSSYYYRRVLEPDELHFFRISDFGPDSSFGGCAVAWTR